MRTLLAAVEGGGFRDAGYAVGQILFWIVLVAVVVVVIMRIRKRRR
jgi:hypothetical protein